MNLVERVKGIILTPSTEWPVIEREPGDAAYLFKNYVTILAAIPAVAGLVGSLLRGVPLGSALLWAIVQYVLAFVGAYVMALIINGLAPRFGGVPNADNALKLAVYSSTPSWLAGIFAIVPGLAFLAILGLYGFYLLYLGVAPLMRVPPEKAVGFTVVVVILAIIVIFLIALVPILMFGLPR